MGGSSDARIEQVKTCHRAPVIAVGPDMGPCGDSPVPTNPVVAGLLAETHGASQEVALAFGHHEDRTPTHGYEPTREAAMAAFAKSCRRE